MAKNKLAFARVKRARKKARTVSSKRAQESVHGIPTSLETKPQTFPKELPGGYGDNQIFLMVRDPYWLYAYWEIQKDHEQTVLNQLGGNREEVQSILRIYETSNPRNPPVFFNIKLQGLADNWYIQVEPNRSYLVEIGLLHKDGRFLALARSNEVTTPRSGMSEVIDEQWMGIDFEKMYALSGGFTVGKSSLELRKLMEERLAGAISSGSGKGLFSSFASPVKSKRTNDHSNG